MKSKFLTVLGLVALSFNAAAADQAIPQISVAFPKLLEPTTLKSTRFIGNNSTIKNLVINNMGAVTRTREGSSGAVFSDISMDNSAFLFRAYQWNDLLTNAKIQRVRSVNASAAGFITLRGDSSNMLIEDFYVVATKPNTENDKVPSGIGFSGKGMGDKGSNIIIRNGHIEGIRSEVNGFKNGDGISVERKYQNVSITNVYSGSNSDAGFDIKSPTATLDNTIAENNRRNYKFWDDQTHGKLVSINPGNAGSGAAAHIQLQGSAAKTHTIRIKNLVVRSNNKTPVFQVENGVYNIIVENHDIQVPEGTSLLQAAGKAKGSTLSLGKAVDPVKPVPSNIVALTKNAASSLDAKDAVTNAYLLDTRNGVQLGTVNVKNFGAKDIVMTTLPVRDGNGDGIVVFNKAGLGISGNNGAKTTVAARLMMTDISGQTLSNLQAKGTVVNNGTTYYLYGLKGAAVDKDAIKF